MRPLRTAINEGAFIVMNTNTVAVASIYRATRNDVWQALVDPDRLRRWFGDVVVPAGDGQSIHIAVTGTGEEIMVQVRSFVAECRLVLDWSVDGSTSTVSVILGDAFPGTAVILQEDGTPTEMLDAYRRGWKAHLGRLDAELSGSAIPDWTTLAQGTGTAT